MPKNDKLYPKNFTKKAEYKLANLMKHDYDIELAGDGWVRVSKNEDILLILANGEVFKKTIY